MNGAWAKTPAARAVGFPFGSGRAFTLVELLVAMAVTAMIVALALSVVFGSVVNWGRLTGKINSAAQANVALDQLTADLQNALDREDGQVWLAASVLDRSDNSGFWQAAAREKPAGAANDSLDLANPNFRATRYGQAGIWLRFMVSAPGRNDATSVDATAATLSAPVCVAYQIVRRASANGSSSGGMHYLLHRSQVRPAQVGARPGAMEAGYDLDPSDPASLYLSSGPNNDATEIGDPFSVRQPTQLDNVLAENVIDFGVRFYARDSLGNLTATFPKDDSDTEHLVRSAAPDDGTENPFPAVVDLMIRVLTDEGARQIAALEADSVYLGARPALYASDAAWWWGIAEAHSQVLTRRVTRLAQAQ
jgi:prepilin-type N-terminal cleavage/methylation domain-containing protein